MPRAARIQQQHLAYTPHTHLTTPHTHSSHTSHTPSMYTHLTHTTHHAPTPHRCHVQLASSRSTYTQLSNSNSLNKPHVITLPHDAATLSACCPIYGSRIWDGIYIMSSVSPIPPPPSLHAVSYAGHIFGTVYTFAHVYMS